MEVLFCECGRIHFLDNDKTAELLYSGGSTIYICQYCGNIYETWLTKTGDEYTWNRRRVYEIDYEPAKDKIKHISSSRGISIPLEDGLGSADYYYKSFFGCSQATDMEKEDIKVDMQYLISKINDEEKLKCLSNYYIENMDWKGTKYERK